MKDKKFHCANVPSDSMGVGACVGTDRVAVWWTHEDSHAIHMTPAEARRMGKRLIKLANKQEKLQ